MSILMNSCRILFLLCIIYNVNTSLVSAFRRWFPRPSETNPSFIRPQDLENFILTTEQDQHSFNETLSHILVPRVPGTPSHDKVADYIIKYMQQYDWKIEEQKFTSKTPIGDKSFNNIIATLNPDGCKKVILACHYDSKYFHNFEFLAASDSAVPCTMILELARILNEPLKRSLSKDIALQFIFFDGEEAFVQWSAADSLYGSKHMARVWRSQKPHTKNCPPSIRTELARIDLFILLDLIGEKDPAFCNSYRSALPHFNHLNDIEHRLRMKNLIEGSHPDRGSFKQTNCGWNRIEDDQVPFEQNGVRKILHLIAVPFPQVWHQKEDDENMIHHPTINNLMKIFRVFFIEYFHLKV